MVDGSEADKEMMKKKCEALEKSFNKLEIIENPSKATSRRKNAVESGIRLMKEIYDPNYGQYNDRERMLKMKSGYSEYTRMTGQSSNMRSVVSDNVTKSKNSWHSKKVMRSSVQMRMRGADRSDSEPDDEEVEQQEEQGTKVVKRVKSLFRKSKN